MKISKADKEKITDIGVALAGGAMSLLGLLPPLLPVAAFGVLIPSVYGMLKTSGVFKADAETEITGQMKAAFENTFNKLLKDKKYKDTFGEISGYIAELLEAKIITADASAHDIFQIIENQISNTDDIKSLSKKEALQSFENAFLTEIVNEDNRDYAVYNAVVNISGHEKRLAYLEKEASISKSKRDEFDKRLKKIELTIEMYGIQLREAPPILPFENLIGRTKYIYKSIDYLNSAKNILYMYGMGGIGKTYLCASVCSKNIVDKDNVFWFKCVASLEDGISKISAATTDNKNKEENIEQVKNFLHALDKRYLLVFDNLENITQDDTDFLSKLSCRVIITSRKKHEVLLHMSNHQYIDLIDDDSCVDIFKHYSTVKDILDSEIEDLKKVISLAGNHTQAIEIIAGIYNKSAAMNTIKSLYETIKNTGFNMKTETSTNKDPEKRDFTGHMKHLFDISGIKNDADKVYILKNMCVLPSMPVNFLDFLKWLGAKYENTIIELESSSWLKRKIYRTADSDKLIDTVEMHQIIGDTMKKELSPSFIDCGVLILALDTEIDKDKADPGRYKAEYMPFCISVGEYFKRIENLDIGHLYYTMAKIYGDISEYEKAMEYFNLAFNIRKIVLGKEHPNTAATYNNIAGVYQAMGDYHNAIEYFFLALDIVEKVFGKDHPDTATIYNNIAVVYKDLRNYPKALYYFNLALNIKEKVLGKNHTDIALTYNNIASLHHSMGDYQKALEYCNLALNIREKTLGKDHLATAATYNNIAGVYQDMGNYPKALDYYTLALSIYEKVLGKEHPDTAAIYNNIASLYYAAGDYQKALEYYPKSLYIMQNKLGSKHPRLKTVHKNTKICYKKYDADMAKFENWLDEALQKAEKDLKK